MSTPKIKNYRWLIVVLVLLPLSSITHLLTRKFKILKLIALD